MITHEDDRADSFPETVAIVGVKVRDTGEVKKTRTNDHSLRQGDHVIFNARQ